MQPPIFGLDVFPEYALWEPTPSKLDRFVEVGQEAGDVSLILSDKFYCLFNALRSRSAT